MVLELQQYLVLTGGEYEITAKYNGDDNYEEKLLLHLQLKLIK